MLSQKAISKKRLAVSAGIISVMIIGSGFMLYKNKNFLFGGNANIDIVLDSDMATDENNSDKIGALDLKIFSSDKFKALKESAQSGKSPAEIGKRDPFRPN
ncbi:MAG: hypothetical protein V1667_00520 [bacterium]